MSAPAFETVQVGDAVPERASPPVTRAMLALYAGASGDHNPVHIDSDFAKAAGLDDVFAHGMLVMAWVGQALVRWVPQDAIVEFGGRFKSVTHVGDRITCGGRVVEKPATGSEDCVRVELFARDDAGDVKFAGYAVVKLR